MICFLAIFLFFLSVLPAGADVLATLDAQEHTKLNSAVLNLSKKALTSYLLYNRKIDVPKDLPSVLLKEQAGVFVTLYNSDEKRGCWGSVNPSYNSIAQDIIEHSIAAAMDDKRYFNVDKSELADLSYSVSILGELEPVNSMRELHPSVYGLLVRDGEKGAVLLPGEAKTARWQILECKRLAGIAWNIRAEMYRFKTILFEL